MAKKGTGQHGKQGSKGKSAFRSGTSSTNPDRALPSSQRQGFYRSRGTIKLLNLYKSKPEWIKQKGKKGSSKQKLQQPTAPARIEPDRRWFGNVRVVDQNKLAVFREELSKAVNDPFSVVLRRSRLPLSLLSGGDEGGKTQYSKAGIAACSSQSMKEEEEEEAAEEEEEQQQQPRLTASALLSLEPFADTFGGRSHRKRPLLRVHSLASLALQGERRRERYMGGAAAAGSKSTCVGSSSSTTSQEATASGEAVSGDAPRSKYTEDDSTPLASEEIFKKGTSKRIWGELYKVVDASDVLVQVLDARDPLGTRCRRLEQYLRKHKQAKHLVFLLNKVDLIPASVARGWVQLLSSEAPTLLFQAKRQERPAGKLQLFQLLRQYAQLMSDRKHVSVGFIGYPNVGKSSIINALRNKQVCAAAPVPGHTRVWQYVALTKRLYLIDCPGVVPASEDVSDSLKVIRGVVRPERIQCPEEHIDELLRRVQPDHVRARYGLADACVWNSAEEFLEILARKKGRLRRGGEADISTTARIVLYDLQRGRLPYFVPPPFNTDKEHRKAAEVAAAAAAGAAAAEATEEVAAAAADAAEATEEAVADAAETTADAAEATADAAEATADAAEAPAGAAARALSGVKAALSAVVSAAEASARGMGSVGQRKKRRAAGEAVELSAALGEQVAAAAVREGDVRTAKGKGMGREEIITKSQKKRKRLPEKSEK